MTRDDLVAQTRHVADAESDGRWPGANILLGLNLVFRREWRNILNANRYYRVGTRTVTPASDGTFALSSLTTGSGDSTETFYRVLSVARGQNVYQEIQHMDVAVLVGGGGESWAHQSWFRTGDYIQVVPISVDACTVIVNHLPPLPSTLATGSSTVVYPAGYEEVLTYETAALMLSKGGTETEAASFLKQLAEEMRRDMLADVARISTNPLQVVYPDSRTEWSG